MTVTKWDARFLQIASVVASWSKDPSTRVGAAIVSDKQRVVSLGFNGYPRGVEDNMDVPRETKLARVIHAESNAVLFAQRDLTGCTIYVTRPPCSNCAALIIQSGIARVVYEAPDPSFMTRWRESVDASLAMLAEAGVDVLSLEV